mmetsp:Transcript_95443/g.270193  ORF Transcript_95443/g.270193 Transcript_95443/m.270193 type:complete len:410 (+) Transcript_95443:53-1282(+)
MWPSPAGSPASGAGPAGAPALSPLEALVRGRVYTREDPFKRLTKSWLRGDAKGAPDIDDYDDIDEREAYARTEAVRRANEAARVQQLAEVSSGHLTWLRARKLGTELRLPRDHVRMGERSASAPALPPAVGPPRMESSVWFRVKGPTGAMQCWRADVVAEALGAAQGIGLECPTIEITMARRAVRRNPAMLPSFRRFLEAVCSNARRELWNPTFLRQLEERWAVRDVCPVSEEELRRRLPEVRFPVPTSELPPPAPPTPLTVRVPPAVAQALLEDGEPPPPPHVPERLPCRNCYVQAEPWTHILHRPALHGPPWRRQPSDTTVGYGASLARPAPVHSNTVPSIPAEDLYETLSMDSRDVESNSSLRGLDRVTPTASMGSASMRPKPSLKKSALAGSAKMKHKAATVTFE